MQKDCINLRLPVRCLLYFSLSKQLSGVCVCRRDFGGPKCCDCEEGFWGVPPGQCKRESIYLIILCVYIIMGGPGVSCELSFCASRVFLQVLQFSFS